MRALLLNEQQPVVYKETIVGMSLLASYSQTIQSKIEELLV